MGTTSACAENTGFALSPLAVTRNYLRVRGEYGISMRVEGATRELPPRARRIPVARNRRHRRMGTTSACAENTIPNLADRLHGGNYLRVRGEYKSISATIVPK